MNSPDPHSRSVPTARRQTVRRPGPVEARIAEFSQVPRIQAGSLVLSVFGDLLLARGGRVWLGSLIQLLTPLGVNDRMIRTAIFRLAQENWLVAEAHGRRADYSLTASGAQRIRDASRRIYAAQSPAWDQRWRLVFQVKEMDAPTRDAVRRFLFWQGFGSLGPHCFVHPTTDLDRVFQGLSAEGLASACVALLPVRAADAAVGQSASPHDLVMQAWNLEDLADRYSAFVARYEPIAEVLMRGDQADLSPQNALLVRLLLIHDYRRLLLRDPNLPAALLPPAWPGEAARAVCRRLYRLLLAPSEDHIDRMLVTANNAPLPPADQSLAERFQGPDPLSDKPLR
ncbi:MAG: phenylacetic acid degradation operon negative regulatory protein PaaX [Burkholderiaceae bacterium]